MTCANLPTATSRTNLPTFFNEGAVLVVEPNVEELPKELAERSNVELAELDDAIERADIVLVMVDHDPFKDYDLEKLQEKVVIDTKGLWR